MLGAYGFDCCRAVGARRDDLNVHVTLEKPLQPVQHDRMVIGEDDPNRHHAAPAIGTAISMRDPLFDDSIDISPPSDAARSRRLAGPRFIFASTPCSYRPSNGNPRPSSLTTMWTLPLSER